MKTNNKPKIKQLLSGSVVTLLTVFAALPAIAEDIEIYKAENIGGAAINPNIMFVLDTSGSMDGEMYAPPAYDVAQADFYYTQTSGCFEKDRMYVSDTANIMSCDPKHKEVSFLKTQNECLGAQQAFAAATGQGRGTGIYNSTYAQWNDTNDYWGLLKNASDPNFVIECKADMYDHGDGQPQKKCINTFGGTAPFADCVADSIYSWSQIENESVTMYDGNWLNYQLYVNTNADVNDGIWAKTKYIEIMKSTIAIIANSVDDVNLGLMRFDSDYGTWKNPGGHGGSVSYQVQPSDIGRANMLSQLKGWTAKGYTPLSETMFEAYRYFSGGEVLFGDVASPKSTGGSTLTGTPGQYASPVDIEMADCQSQYIILLSDGLPTYDTEADALIKALPGFTSPGGNSTSCSPNGNEGHGNCLDDLAGYMYNHGFTAEVQDPDTKAMVTVEDVKLATYTIAFGDEIPILKTTAEVSGGEYKNAKTATDLLETFLNMLSAIKDLDSTFSSPAVSVNAFNRTTHRNELYFTVFKPSVKPHWDGNFKRFKLSFDKGIPSIVDQNDVSAIDNKSGFFKDDALSFWTSSQDAPNGDGRDTSIGGAASKLTDPATRKMYTALTNSDLNHSSNLVKTTTSGLKAAMGWDGAATSSDYYDNLVNWVRGMDIDDVDQDSNITEARRVMGDPLHAQPALVQYAGPDSDPDITAYIATNDGILHAFSTKTGEEQFSFLPAELLPEMDTLYKNSGTQKFYGLDGTVVPYIIDNDLNGIIDGQDKVYVFFGMRRGGSNYYALDVTNRDAPKLMWTIKGGVVNPAVTPLVPVDSTLGDYSHLGQTWSTPGLRIVKLNGADVPVLIFAAGYDTNQDSAKVRTVDKIGRGIYIVDAMTGKPLWRMGPDALADLTDANMLYSIPSDVSSVDTDGDGYVDHLYVGDMGGQVWRVDIDNYASKTASKLVVTAGRIADLADATTSTNRRFYYSPSVALSKDSNDDAYAAIVISSGNRAHPTDRAVQDRVFMIRETPVNGKPVSYQTVVVNDTLQQLYDATPNTIGQGTAEEQKIARNALSNANGWYINLNLATAEKSITKALIFAGEIFFTTYEPFDKKDATVTSCQPQVGNGYLYHVYMSDGRPVKNYDTIVNKDPENLTWEDRRVTLARSGIPADPTVICTDEGCAQCVGTECDKLDSAGTHKTIYWFEE